MLFNSYVFIFLFLPITLIGFALLGTLRLRRAGVCWLIVCSMYYYGSWSTWYLRLLLVSMVLNYLIGAIWVAQTSGPARRIGLASGLAFNLATLAYFKYANLIVLTFNALTGSGVRIGAIVLPLGISFFTFQKIAYLVDSYKGKGYSRDFPYYCLFVLFFPQLIAGPIVHPREILPQFARKTAFGITWKNLGVGLSLFFFGLAKKTLFADTAAPIANRIFDAAAAGLPLDVSRAWLGVLAYSMQIYFDFSGYTDMAIGLSRMFGVRFPVNFNSPYKAVNIIDFWRRWHMTLSRFLRDYLYIPLGGNRKGPARRYINLMITMLLGGLWHGANWTFLAWGGLHGIYLCINHVYSSRLSATAGDGGLRWKAAWRRGITFLAVAVAWVFFRSENFTTAGRMLGAMCGRHGLQLDVLARSHMRWPTVLALMLFCFLAPNTQQVMALARPALGVLPPPPQRRAGRLLWQPTTGWALYTACLGLLCLLFLSRLSEFIYYQF